MKNIKLSVLFFSIFFLLVNNSTEAQRVKGSGNVIDKGMAISPFESIEVSSAFTVELIQSGKEFVKIETDDNIMPYILVEVKGKNLRIRFKKGARIRKTTKLKAIIGFNELTKIRLSGATDLEAKELLTFDELTIKTSGASSLNLNLKAKQLFVDCSGASDLDLSGQVDKLNIELSGASELNAYLLHAKNCVADVSGASDAKIFASEKLSLEASGASSVEYKGNPTEVDVEEHSASSIRKR